MLNIVHTHPKITFFAVTSYCTLQCKPNFYDKKYYSFDTSLTKKWLGLTVGTRVFSSLSVLMWQFSLVCYMENTTRAPSSSRQLERKGVLLLAKCHWLNALWLLNIQCHIKVWRTCSLHVQNDVTKPCVRYQLCNGPALACGNVAWHYKLVGSLLDSKKGRFLENGC